MYFSIGNFCGSWFGDCSIGLAWGSENSIWPVKPESLDIERLHIAALTWDAMFTRSRRGAILAGGGGGGGGVKDAVAIWRPTEVGRSVPRLVVAITRVWRKRSITSDFPKTKRGSVYMFSIFVV